MPTRLMFKVIRLVNINNKLTNSYLLRTQHCGCQSSFYSSKPTDRIVKFIDPVTGEEKKARTNIIPKITLINGDQLTVTTLEEAQNLSKRRDLRLVKIIDLDTKTQRPVYKLMLGSEYHAEDLKQREQKKKDKQKSGTKGEKVLIVSHNITEHDLQTDIKKITKWLAKSYEVRVVINGDSANTNKAEQVYSYIENALKSQARFFQKRQKGSDIKFQIYPPKKQKDDDAEKDL